MAEDPQLRQARLALLTHLRSAVLQNIGDISEMAPEEARQS
jgi:glycyl-tRNA synthetase beta subunit